MKQDFTNAVEYDIYRPWEQTSTKFCALRACIFNKSFLSLSLSLSLSLLYSVNVQSLSNTVDAHI